jgi:hypothetical protein
VVEATLKLSLKRASASLRCSGGMSPSASYKEDLVLADDTDADRRGAMVPSEWRTDILDVFAEEITAAGTESVLELGCGTG